MLLSFKSQQTKGTTPKVTYICYGMNMKLWYDGKRVISESEILLSFYTSTFKVIEIFYSFLFI